MNAVLRIVRKLLDSVGGSLRTVPEAKLHVQTSGQNISMTTSHTSKADGITEHITIELCRDDAQQLARKLVYHFTGLGMNDIAKVLSLAEMSHEALQGDGRQQEAIRNLEAQLRDARTESRGAETPRVQGIRAALDGVREAAAHRAALIYRFERMSSNTYVHIREKLEQLFGVSYDVIEETVCDSTAKDELQVFDGPRKALPRPTWPDEEDDWGN